MPGRGAWDLFAFFVVARFAKTESDETKGVRSQKREAVRPRIGALRERAVRDPSSTRANNRIARVRVELNFVGQTQTSRTIRALLHRLGSSQSPQSSAQRSARRLRRRRTQRLAPALTITLSLNKRTRVCGAAVDAHLLSKRRE